MTSIAVDDFNGDGIADVGLTDGPVQVLLGRGDGTFIVPQVTGYNGNTPAIAGAVEDFNHDGKPDFGVVIGNNQYTVFVEAGNGDGTLQAHVPYAVTANPRAIAAGDFNGDGLPDIAVTSWGQSSQYLMPGTLSVFLNNGDGTFSGGGHLCHRLAAERCDDRRLQRRWHTRSRSYR